MFQFRLFVFVSFFSPFVFSKLFDFVKKTVFPEISFSLVFLFFCVFLDCFFFCGRTDPFLQKSSDQQTRSPQATFTPQTTTQAKSWRSDASIILPGWEHHTDGSWLTPTVHPCPLRRGGCGWLVTATQHLTKMSANSDMVAGPLVEYSSAVSRRRAKNEMVSQSPAESQRRHQSESLVEGPPSRSCKLCKAV